MPHAVARLRADRLARSAKPFRARRGSQQVRCGDCRLVTSHCLCGLLCGLCPRLRTRAGVCLLMGDVEPLKPSNTGWLVADLVEDCFAFGWSRTDTDPGLLALLHDPQWQPWLVFPAAYAAPERVVHHITPPRTRSGECGKRPLFILLDGTWPEARKMFRKSACLDALPVLSLSPAQRSLYKLRRARQDDQLCTSEVAAMCLDLAGEGAAAQRLAAYLDVFTHHYLQARNQLPVAWQDAAHQRLQALGAAGAQQRSERRTGASPADAMAATMVRAEPAAQPGA